MRRPVPFTLTVTSLLFLATVVSSAKTVTLTVGHAWDVDRLAVQKKFDAQFMKDHPNIKIKAENGDWASHQQRYLVRAAAGTLPDVLYLLGGWSQNWIDRGLFRDLNPYIKATPNFRLDDFYMQGLTKYRRGSSLYLIPYAWDPISLYVNKNLLERSGVPYPQKDWTFDTLATVTGKLTRDTNSDNKMDQWGLSFPIVNWLIQATYMMPFGGRLVNEDETKCLISEAKSVKAMEWWANLVLKTHAAPWATENSGGWAKGKIGIVVDGPWSIRYYNGECKFKWDVAHMPIGPAGRFTAAESSGYGITKACKHPQEAWTYINAYMSSAGQRMMWGNTYEQASRKSAKDLTLPGAPPSYSILYDILDDYAVDAPMHIATTKIQDVVAAYWTSVMQGKRSWAQAADMIQKEADLIIKRFRK